MRKIKEMLEDLRDDYNTWEGRILINLKIIVGIILITLITIIAVKMYNY